MVASAVCCCCCFKELQVSLNHSLPYWRQLPLALLMPAKICAIRIFYVPVRLVSLRHEHEFVEVVRV